MRAGLLDHYYDGCIGMLPTPDRKNSFNFTVPFTPSTHSGLLYKPGNHLTDQQAHNVTGKKIGKSNTIIPVLRTT